MSNVAQYNLYHKGKEYVKLLPKNMPCNLIILTMKNFEFCHNKKVPYKENS